MNDFPPEGDERLRSLLAAQMSPLPDAGFTRRVMRALPPRPTPRISPAWWVLIGTFAGFGFAWLKGATWTGLIASSTELTQAGAAMLAFVTNPCFVLALTTTGLSLLLAFVITRQVSTRYY